MRREEEPRKGTEGRNKVTELNVLFSLSGWPAEFESVSSGELRRRREKKRRRVGIGVVGHGHREEQD